MVINCQIRFQYFNLVLVLIQPICKHHIALLFNFKCSAHTSLPKKKANKKHHTNNFQVFFCLKNFQVFKRVKLFHASPFYERPFGIQGTLDIASIQCNCQLSSVSEKEKSQKRNIFEYMYVFYLILVNICMLYLYFNNLVLLIFNDSFARGFQIKFS